LILTAVLCPDLEKPNLERLRDAARSGHQLRGAMSWDRQVLIRSNPRSAVALVSRDNK
jgi:hypothetical protein